MRKISSVHAGSVTMLCGVAVFALLILTGCESQAVKEAPLPTGKPAAGSGDSSSTTTGSKSEGFETTPSGLKYKIVRKGNGRKPEASNEVRVNYKGWLDDGAQFDSSYDRGEPTEFPLNRVIPGWTEGLQLVDEGGEIELEIPSDLGYGPRGSPPKIPPGATLHFKVELLKIL